MTDVNTSVLFQPLTIKTLSLPNRIVMAPMTRSRSPGGVPGENVAAYYRRRAEGGVGLILSEGTIVDRPSSGNEPDLPFFHGAPALEGWRRVIDEVHAGGGKMGPQIWHTGSAISPSTDWTPATEVESPSALVAPGHSRGMIMSDEAIAGTISAFARAAADAKRLGFDTLEIHAAHGYLIDQFFWAGTNLRTDAFGGATIRERSRFAVEVVRAVRAAVGEDFPIILRISQWKQQALDARIVRTPDEMAEWLAPLVEAGVDVIDCSQRRFWEPEFPEIDGTDGLNLAGWAKKLTGAATISVGSVGLDVDAMATFMGQEAMPAELDRLIARMDRGEFDMIAVGRALLGDADWASKVRDGRYDQLSAFSPKSLAELV